MPDTVPRLRRVKIVRRDWPRLIADLHGLGMNDESIALALRLRSSTVRNWKYGAEPLHSTGEALLALYKQRMALYKQRMALAVIERAERRRIFKANAEKLRRKARKEAALQQSDSRACARVAPC